jgi:hypothetical protein
MLLPIAFDSLAQLLGCIGHSHSLIVRSLHGLRQITLKWSYIMYCDDAYLLVITLQTMVLHISLLMTLFKLFVSWRLYSIHCQLRHSTKTHDIS